MAERGTTLIENINVALTTKKEDKNFLLEETQTRFSPKKQKADFMKW